MLLGRSVFQSVVDRLQSESQADCEAMPSTPQGSKPRINSDLLFDQLNQGEIDADSVDPAKAYRDFAWDAEAPTPPFEYAETISSAPTPVDATPEPEPEPQPLAKDYTYLEKTQPSDIKMELKIEKLTSIEALNNKRRKFARDNHPDLVPETYRDNANLRMTVANQLIDQAIKQLELRSRLGA